MHVTCIEIDIQRSISPWRDLVALFHIYLFLKKERVVIAHSTTPKAGLLTALAAFFAGVPVRLHTFTGQPWVDMTGLKRQLARFSDRVIGKLNTRCYSDSLSQREFLIKQRIVDATDINVIGAGSLAGVDIRRFAANRVSSVDCASVKARYHIPIDAPVILFLGRITVDKGVRELLSAFEILKASNSKAHLLFVGQFDADSGAAGVIRRNEIERFSDTHIVGYSDCPETFLAIADFLCLPSYREGFGTVVIEAASMGVPTVGTNIYGLSDAVVHGETGLLVAPRNVEELSRAMRRMLESKALCRQMGDAARRRAHTLFDSEKVNRMVAEEYCAMLQKISPPK
ncbi:MAG TPA: glycosyltransferase family 4 protein, partial [Rhodoferax sp.]|nr:glycosyltransferase family 4 protein [Rhodoferax sp.]